MAIAFDALTRFPVTENTSDITAGDRTFTHTPSGTPKGAVCVLMHTSTTNVDTCLNGILYGGIPMGLAVRAIDTTELGAVVIYTLTDVPSGAQTITLQGCNTAAKFVSMNTVTAATSGVEIHATNFTDTTVTANPSLSMTITKECMSFAGMHSGDAAPADATIVAGSTEQNNLDYGALMCKTLRRTATDTANFSFAYTLISDDWCFAGVSVSEISDQPGRSLIVMRQPITTASYW